MALETAGSTQLIEDELMSQIEKNFFFDGMTMPASLFLRLKPNTYILIGKPGEVVQISSMKGFHHENFHVFVRKTEKNLVTSFISRLVNTTLENPELGFDAKAGFIQNLLADSFDELEKSKFTTFSKLRNVGSQLVRLSKQAPSIDQALRLLKDQKPSDSRHSMATCVVSLMMAEEANQLNNLNQEKLVAGALLHDVGLRHLPPSFKHRSPHEWSAQELQIYESHPIKGAEMLRQIQGMSVEVMLIVSEHHENSQGTGFPKRIRDVKMNPLSKIVALADCVTDLILPERGQSFSADEALQYIENVLGQPYNKPLFLALKNIINKSHLEEKMKKIS
jgi:putative nucleotidyltransferase with HDIG domain